MDRLDELAIFIAIVEEGSLVRAAGRLRRSAPSVTRGLAALEDRVGLRLVDRTTRRMATTDAGRALFDRARTLLAEYDAATRAAGNAPLGGVLRITAPVQFGRRHVVPVVDRFLDRFPGIEIELMLVDRNLDLIDEAIDVAVRIGTLADSGLSVRRVGEVRRLWVASPAYLEKRGTPRAPADLAGHEILAGPSSPAQDWVFGQRPRGATTGTGERLRGRLKGRLRVDDVETRLGAARAGRGIAQLLSYQVADDLASGALVRLLKSCEPSPLPVQLVTKGRHHRPPKVEAFVAFAAEHLAALPVVRRI